jgi:hypothetical protein
LLSHSGNHLISQPGIVRKVNITFSILLQRKWGHRVSYHLTSKQLPRGVQDFWVYFLGFPFSMNAHMHIYWGLIHLIVWWNSPKPKPIVLVHVYSPFPMLLLISRFFYLQIKNHHLYFVIFTKMTKEILWWDIEDLKMKIKTKFLYSFAKFSPRIY